LFPVGFSLTLSCYARFRPFPLSVFVNFVTGPGLFFSRPSSVFSHLWSFGLGRVFFPPWNSFPPHRSSRIFAQSTPPLTSRVIRIRFPAVTMVLLVFAPFIFFPPLPSCVSFFSGTFFKGSRPTRPSFFVNPSPRLTSSPCLDVLYPSALSTISLRFMITGAERPVSLRFFFLFVVFPCFVVLSFYRTLLRPSTTYLLTPTQGNGYPPSSS